jgi:hypothetical protein
MSAREAGVSRHAQTTTRYFDKALAFAVPKQGSKVVVELATADQVLEGLTRKPSSPIATEAGTRQ